MKYEKDVKEFIESIQLKKAVPTSGGTYLYVWTQYNMNSKKSGGRGSVTINISKCIIGDPREFTTKCKLYKKNSNIGVDKIVSLDSLFEYNNQLEDYKHVY